MKKWLALILPLIPLTIGIVSTFQNHYGFNRTVMLQIVCIAITAGLLLWNRRDARWSDWLLPVAYLCCMGGDAFLFHRGDKEWMFIAGIALFGLTHLSYFTLMISNGKLNRPVGAVVTGGLLIYFVVCLLPLPDMPLGLKIAVLIYLLLSCLTLSAATGLRLAKPEKTAFIAGVALMLFSDTTISFKEFLHWTPLNILLMPTYYYSLILMCTGMCLKLSHPAKPLPVLSLGMENAVDIRSSGDSAA